MQGTGQENKQDIIFTVHETGQVNVQDVVLLFKQVREYRKNNPICLSAKDNVDISNILDEIITNDAYKEDYNNQTARLLYESYPYSKCIESLKQIRKLLIDYSLL